MTRFDRASRAMWLLQIVALLLGISLQLASQAQAPSQVDTRNVAALNVSIAVFDPGVPADASLHRGLQVFPRIREIEAKFLPFILRDTLAETNEWGAVRVVPLRDEAAELLVSGSIVRSDGEALEIKVRAVDASGRVWLDQVFTGVVTNNYEQHDSASIAPGYQSLYDQIAEELLLARARLNRQEITSIVEISLLRYAIQLAPSAFGDYLTAADDGTFTLRRLPAKNDPMLDRIQRMRGTVYVITDTVDAKFQELHTEIAPIYDLWREYRRKSTEYKLGNARRAQSTKSDAPRGSYEAMKNLYDNYKFDRITAQEQDRLAVAFHNEVGPTIDSAEARVAELESWVEWKYTEWHIRLEELFEVEAGLYR